MGDSSWMLIVYILVFIAIFYFLAMRPQQKQRKAHAALLASLKKGDTIMTASGIYGRVKRVEEDFVVVEVAKGVNIKIARRAVAEILRDSSQARAVAPEGTGGSRGRRTRAVIEEPMPEELEEAASDEVGEMPLDENDHLEPDGSGQDGAEAASDDAERELVKTDS